MGERSEGETEEEPCGRCHGNIPGLSGGQGLAACGVLWGQLGSASSRSEVTHASGVEMG